MARTGYWLDVFKLSVDIHLKEHYSPEEAHKEAIRRMGQSESEAAVAGMVVSQLEGNQ